MNDQLPRPGVRRPDERPPLAHMVADLILFARDYHLRAADAAQDIWLRRFAAEIAEGFHSLLGPMIPMICDDVNPAGLLRLVADAMDKKRSGPYDDQIRAAYEAAFLLRVKSHGAEHRTMFARAWQQLPERFRTGSYRLSDPTEMRSLHRALKPFTRVNQVAFPSFAEVETQFKKACLLPRPLKERSLRRALKRLFLFLRPGRRGA